MNSDITYMRTRIESPSRRQGDSALRASWSTWRSWSRWRRRGEDEVPSSSYWEAPSARRRFWDSAVYFALRAARSGGDESPMVGMGVGGRVFTVEVMVGWVRRAGMLS